MAAVGMEKLKDKAGAKSSLLIYIVFFVAYSVIAVFSSGLGDMGEFTSAACSAALLGRNWTELMPAAPTAANALIRGLLYLPAMLLCGETVLQYKLFLVINSALYAIIPFTAYRIAALAGAEKVWQRIAAAIICGAVPILQMQVYYAGSDGYGAVCLWLLLLILFNAVKNEGDRAAKRLRSVAAAVLTAFAGFCSDGLYSVFFAVVIFTVVAITAHRKRPILLSVYVPLYLLLTLGNIAVTVYFSDLVPNVKGDISGILDLSRFDSFLPFVCGRVYYLVLSTFGFAAAGMAIAAVAMVSYYRSRKSGRQTEFTEANALNGMLILLLTVLTILMDSFLSAPKDKTIADVATLIGSPAIMAVCMPAMLYFLVYNFTKGLKFLTVMISIAGVAALSAGSVAGLAFVIGKYPQNNCETLLAELSPLRVGTGLSAELTSENLIYPVCFILSVFMVLVAVTCSAERMGGKVCAWIISGVGFYLCAAGLAAGIILRIQPAENLGESSRKIMNIINDYSDGSHSIEVVRSDKLLALHLQYAGQAREIKYTSDESLITDCICVSEHDISTDKVCVLIGRTDGYNIYAVGDIRGNTDIEPESNSSIV